MTLEQQEELVKIFNHKIEYYRDKYHSLFIPNYRESSSLYARKRMGFTLAYNLIKAILEKEIKDTYEHA